MAITYTWTISTTERTLADGGVTVASASSYGTAGFTPDASADGFVAYDSLTEANVLAWVWGQSETWKADVEASIASKIDALANPTTEAGVPW
jgi:hypothetical protein